MNKKLRVGDLVIRALIWLSAGITVFILLGIILYVFIRGLPHVSWELLTTAPSELKGTVGILPIMINTVYTVVITLLIATPVGICSAIYLTEYAKKGRLVRLIEFTTETLAGIPSIIYGLFGFVFFCILFGLGYSILAGALTLTIMSRPTIIRTTQEALRTVPPAIARALGMGVQALCIRTIVLPSAMPGILTADLKYRPHCRRVGRADLHGGYQLFHAAGLF
ncbi:MAG: PstA family ABC transporter permease [Oscillospiraceae bacterium]